MEKIFCDKDTIKLTNLTFSDRKFNLKYRKIFQIVNLKDYPPNKLFPSFFLSPVKNAFLNKPYNFPTLRWTRRRWQATAPCSLWSEPVKRKDGAQSCSSLVTVVLSLTGSEVRPYCFSSVFVLVHPVRDPPYFNIKNPNWEQNIKIHLIEIKSPKIYKSTANKKWNKSEFVSCHLSLVSLC